jgi:hypothetical protein
MLLAVCFSRWPVMSRVTRRRVAAAQDKAALSPAFLPAEKILPVMNASRKGAAGCQHRVKEARKQQLAAS